MPLPTQIRGHLGDRKSHKLGVLKQAKDQPAKQEGSNSSDRPAKRPAYEHQDDLRILKGCHGGDRLPTPLASEGYRIWHRFGGNHGDNGEHYTTWSVLVFSFLALDLPAPFNCVFRINIHT